jgi:hypothetical protein
LYWYVHLFLNECDVNALLTADGITKILATTGLLNSNKTKIKLNDISWTIVSLLSFLKAQM